MNLDQIFKFKRHRSQRWPKIRGIKSKANKILKEAKGYEVEIEPDEWFYYDHVHLDWDGIGDLGAQIRLQTLEAHLCIFKKYVHALTQFDKPYQIFMSFFIDDAGQDAVYIHSENPHSDFPAIFDDVQWDIPEFESFLNSMCPEFNFVAGKREENIVVYVEGIGESLKI